MHPSVEVAIVVLLVAATVSDVVVDAAAACLLVLTTSNGVVKIVAMVPAVIPPMNDWSIVTRTGTVISRSVYNLASHDPNIVEFDSELLHLSSSKKYNALKGTSRSIVGPGPR